DWRPRVVEARARRRVAARSGAAVGADAGDGGGGRGVGELVGVRDGRRACRRRDRHVHHPRGLGRCGDVDLRVGHYGERAEGDVAELDAGGPGEADAGDDDAWAAGTGAGRRLKIDDGGNRGGHRRELVGGRGGRGAVGRDDRDVGGARGQGRGRRQDLVGRPDGEGRGRRGAEEDGRRPVEVGPGDQHAGAAARGAGTGGD